MIFPARQLDRSARLHRLGNFFRRTGYLFSHLRRTARLHQRVRIHINTGRIAITLIDKLGLHIRRARRQLRSLRIGRLKIEMLPIPTRTLRLNIAHRLTVIAVRLECAGRNLRHRLHQNIAGFVLPRQSLRRRLACRPAAGLNRTLADNARHRAPKRTRPLDNLTAETRRQTVKQTDGRPAPNRLAFRRRHRVPVAQRVYYPPDAAAVFPRFRLHAFGHRRVILHIERRRTGHRGSSQRINETGSRRPRHTRRIRPHRLRYRTEDKTGIFP